MRGTRVPSVAFVGIGLVAAAVLPAFLAASLAVEVREDFPLSDATLGLAIAVSFGFAAVVSSPAGRIVDRIGPVRGVQTACALAAACCLLVALAVDSAPALIVVLILAGVVNALAGPSAGSLIAGQVAPRRLGLLFGAQQAGAPAGALLAGLALPVLAVPFGWRWAFAAAALVPGVVALAVQRFARDPGARSRPSSATRPSLHGVGLLVTAATLAYLAAAGMTAFLVLYATSEGISPGVAGAILAATAGAAALSRVAFGVAADARLSPLRVAAALLATGAIGYGFLAVSTEPSVLVAGALIAGGVGWGWVGLMLLALVRRNPDAPGAAVGGGMVGVYIGAAGGPLLVGVLAEHASFRLAWAICAALALGAASIVLVAQRRSGDAWEPEIADT